MNIHSTSVIIILCTQLLRYNFFSIINMKTCDNEKHLSRHETNNSCNWNVQLKKNC
jgi:hypothetical protein